MTRTIGFLSGSALLLCCSGSLGQVIVYDNLAPADWVDYYPAKADVSHVEYGDEILLESGPSTLLSTFSLEYYAQGLSGNETIQVHFYLNSGPLVGNAPSPAAPAFYDSAVLPITDGKHLLTIDNLNVVAPDHFTWTAQFTGLTGSELAGVAVHAPAAVGSSQIGDTDDFWENRDGVWQLFISQGGNPSSFGAQITAVPEPTAYAMVTGAALLGLAIVRRYTTSKIRPWAQSPAPRRCQKAHSRV
jgi:hypothetical protein